MPRKTTKKVDIKIDGYGTKEQVLREEHHFRGNDVFQRMSHDLLDPDTYGLEGEISDIRAEEDEDTEDWSMVLSVKLKGYKDAIENWKKDMEDRKAHI